MREEEIYSILFGFGSNTTFYNWKKDPKRKIIKFIEKYFTKKELEEFLETGKIDKFEGLKATNNFLASYKNKYFNFLHEKMSRINSLTEYQLQFYFSYLFFIRVHHAQFAIHTHPFYASLARFGLDYKKEASISEKDSLHLVYQIVDFLENEKMWDYFVFLLKNNFEHFVESIDLNEYFEQDGITLKTESFLNNCAEEPSDEECEEFLQLKDPLNVDGLDHYYLYHEYNSKKDKIKK